MPIPGPMQSQLSRSLPPRNGARHSNAYLVGG